MIELQNHRILIIDDQKSIHDDYKSILAPRGTDASSLNEAATALLGVSAGAKVSVSVEFEIDSAYQGQDGAEMVRKAVTRGKPYALAFVDMRMPPGWDGLETTLHLWEADPELQIVICSAYSEYSWDETIEKLGQTDRLLILKKPFESVEISQLAHALTTKWELARRDRLKLIEIQNMVDERTSELEKANRELETAQQELVERAHKAGMADIATEVLHNIGNILTSANTSASVIKETIENSTLSRFAKANMLLKENLDNVEDFLRDETKRKKLIDYYLKLEEMITEEHNQIAENATRLMEKINTMTHVLDAQQSYARSGFWSEELSLTEVVEDALTLQSDSIVDGKINVIKEFDEVPKILLQKTKLVHILVNLFKNAREAMIDVEPSNRNLLVKIAKDDESACIRVIDTGSGIEKDNVSRIFSHGFTTKANGHGFGLHSCANAIAEMGGNIWAESEGEGKGATFGLRFPLAKSLAQPASSESPSAAEPHIPNPE